MAKAQSHHLIAKIELCAKKLELCAKSSIFCHSREKAGHKYVDEIDALSTIIVEKGFLP